MNYKFTFLLLITNISLGQVGCRTETQIPSTSPNSRFTDNGNGTITDSGTGLMWQKCQLGLSGSSCTIGSATTHTWQQALDEADSSTLAAYNDWRLPNHKELLSIVEQRCQSESINRVYFPNTGSSPFWSATPVTGSLEYAWYVNFNGGSSGKAYRINNGRVRLVRFGQ